MRRAIAFFAALVVACGITPVANVAASPAYSTVRLKYSPPGQISVATINARQNEILGPQRFEALLELALAFRTRPPAFNGGGQGAVLAPDVIAINEFREANVEIFTRQMRRKFDEPYELVGPTDVEAAIIINTRTVEQQGEIQIVDDACMNDQTTDTPRTNREYPLGRFREIATGAMFSVVSVHLSKDYTATGINDCVNKNVRALRAAVEKDPGAAFIAGDFNFRPTVARYECDPLEESEPTEAWTLMTAGDEDPPGRVFVDAVESFHRERSLPMRDEWTYQSSRSGPSCNGSTSLRRARIDYIFASDVQVAEAHADHPGWSDPTIYKYSDHRFVLGRFVLSGPPRVPRPIAEQLAAGAIRVSWQPVEGATGYIVYRALPGRSYSVIATVTGDQTSFEDNATVHGVNYRYAIAAVGADSGQGVESAPVWQLADAQGPIVTSIIPARGATGVHPDVTIRATFNEWVEATSVRESTISLYRDGNRISGTVVRKGGFVIKFNPTYPLKKGESFTIVVRGVEDVLGNVGPVFKSQFSTVEPPKRRRDTRR